MEKSLHVYVQNTEGVHLLLSPKLGTVPNCAFREGVRLERVHLERFLCIENRERKQQMIDSYPSQVQSTISSEITSISLNNQLEDNYIPLLQGKSLDDEPEVSQRLEAQLPRDSVSSSNHGSSSLHTSVKASDRQIKKRRSKSKSIQVSDLSAINNTRLEQVLNEGEKQIEGSDHILNSHFVPSSSNS